MEITKNISPIYTTHTRSRRWFFFFQNVLSEWQFRDGFLDVFILLYLYEDSVEVYNIYEVRDDIENIGVELNTIFLLNDIASSHMHSGKKKIAFELNILVVYDFNDVSSWGATGGISVGIDKQKVNILGIFIRN